MYTSAVAVLVAVYGQDNTLVEVMLMTMSLPMLMLMLMLRYRHGTCPSDDDVVMANMLSKSCCHLIEDNFTFTIFLFCLKVLFSKLAK